MNRMESVLGKMESVVPPSARRHLNVEGAESEHGASQEDRDSIGGRSEQPDASIHEQTNHNKSKAKQCAGSSKAFCNNKQSPLS
eukprot:13050_6